MIFAIPKSVLVPFEWDGKKWVKRDDLPRFREDSEASLYLQANPQISFRDGKPVPILWIERNEWTLVNEYLRGVGTAEWLSIQPKGTLNG